MTETQVLDKVRDLVADKLSVDPAKIVPSASFRKDLGADSLDTYELVYAIEEELGVTIPDDMANEFEKGSFKRTFGGAFVIQQESRCRIQGHQSAGTVPYTYILCKRDG